MLGISFGQWRGVTGGGQHIDAAPGVGSVFIRSEPSALSHCRHALSNPFCHNGGNSDPSSVVPDFYKLSVCDLAPFGIVWVNPYPLRLYFSLPGIVVMDGMTAGFSVPSDKL